MRISAKIMADNIKANLAKQSAQLSKTQTEISTGKKINSLSDDPEGVGKVLGYRTTLSAIDQYQQNITDAKTRVEYTETILGQINDLVNDAKEIASNADTQDGEALAEEIANIRDQIMSLTNSKYNGSYIFSGDLTDTAPFDETTGDYEGDDGSHSVMVGEGIQITLNADGGEMLTETVSGNDDTVFNVLDDLEAALRSGDETGVSDTVELLANIDENLEMERSKLAAMYTRLEDTENRWAVLSEAVETMRSDVEDTDVTEAAIDLQLQQTSYELLLQVASEVLQPTLLDFL
ncbi:flagellar hook-associated protein 3 [Desulfosarcina ovata subsp. sediminis]|uniref:Flagellar hook-associated protein 3 n=1 Tax=Desulfosarcina ovata subsp. sediminis TaxID=885957 RepID=A0A5K7ZEX8_9BACT|nr:flagellar hook-associated protein FlgL [Desulfosarcina ovata]BBO79824.1 flagellar hook-associated protein 3 [Desulfosarcina ovata subsp. sediminis]